MLDVEAICDTTTLALESTDFEIYVNLNNFILNKFVTFPSTHEKHVLLQKQIDQFREGAAQLFDHYQPSSMRTTKEHAMNYDVDA